MTNLKEAMEAVGQVPALRTFGVTIEGATCPTTLYVTAHSFDCEGEVVHFYTYKLETVAGQTALIAYSTRSMRNWLDVEDVTSAVNMAPGSTKLN